MSEDVSVEQSTTGHPVVDEVLASLSGLEARPAAEHVAAFEQAQDRLREALSEARDDEADDQAGDDQAGAAGDEPAEA